jgi:hypothetical protein
MTADNTGQGPILTGNRIAPINYICVDECWDRSTDTNERFLSQIKYLTQNTYNIYFFLISVCELKAIQLLYLVFLHFLNM